MRSTAFLLALAAAAFCAPVHDVHAMGHHAHAAAATDVATLTAAVEAADAALQARVTAWPVTSKTIEDFVVGNENAQAHGGANVQDTKKGNYNGNGYVSLGSSSSHATWNFNWADAYGMTPAGPNDACAFKGHLYIRFACGSGCDTTPRTLAVEVQNQWTKDVAFTSSGGFDVWAEQKVDHVVCVKGTVLNLVLKVVGAKGPHVDSWRIVADRETWDETEEAALTTANAALASAVKAAADKAAADKAAADVKAAADKATADKAAADKATADKAAADTKAAADEDKANSDKAAADKAAADKAKANSDKAAADKATADKAAADTKAAADEAKANSDKAATDKAAAKAAEDKATADLAKAHADDHGGNDHGDGGDHSAGDSDKAGTASAGRPAEEIVVYVVIILCGLLMMGLGGALYTGSIGGAAAARGGDIEAPTANPMGAPAKAEGKPAAASNGQKKKKKKKKASA